jgi:hypothetical protein
MNDLDMYAAVESRCRCWNVERGRVYTIDLMFKQHTSDALPLLVQLVTYMGTSCGCTYPRHIVSISMIDIHMTNSGRVLYCIFLMAGRMWGASVEARMKVLFNKHVSKIHNALCLFLYNKHTFNLPVPMARDKIRHEVSYNSFRIPLSYRWTAAIQHDAKCVITGSSQKYNEIHYQNASSWQSSYLPYVGQVGIWLSPYGYICQRNMLAASPTGR